MKKIYSVVTLLVLAVMSISAYAQSSASEDAPIDRVFTFTGDSRISVSIGLDEADAKPLTDGKLVLNVPGARQNEQIVIFPSEPTIAIDSIKSAAGVHLYGSEGKFTTYPASWGATESFTVYTKDVDASQTYMVVVDKPEMITIQRQGGSFDFITVPGTEFDIPISDIAAENDIMIRHAKDQFIYSVTKNGKKAKAQSSGRRWLVEGLQAGDVVEVQVETPEIMVPVKFTGKTDAINTVAVNGVVTEDWSKDDFAVKLNSNIKMTYKANWKVQRLEINGTRVSHINDFDISDETPKVIEVIGDPIQNIQITVNCPDYQHLTVKNSDAEGSHDIELTGAETTFEVLPNTYLTFTAEDADGYYFSKFADNIGGTYSVPTRSMFVPLSTRYVTFDIEMDKFQRQDEVTLFVEDFQWENLTVIFKNGLGDVAYTLGNDPSTISGVKDLSTGYSHLPFDANDRLTISGFNTDEQLVMEVYHNGEIVINPNQGFGGVEPGDVIKIFSSKPQAYDVNYTIQENADVEVIHDIKSTVETPAAHSLLHGTDIIIRRPAKAEAQADEPDADTQVKNLEVSVNDEALTPEADGSFHIVATKAMEIKVNDPMVAGIANVAVDTEGPQEIYNLQGIRVGSTADTPALPSGIYIVGGKKIRY